MWFDGGVRQPVGEPRAWTFEQLGEALLRWHDGPKDSAPGWSPISLRPCPAVCRNAGTRKHDCGGGRLHRLDENVESVSCLVLDVEHVTEEQLSAVLAAVAPYRRLVHTTATHSDDDPRVRVVLPLARPVPAAEWRARRMAQLRAWRITDCVDAKTENESRFFYVPTKNARGEGDFDADDGQLLELPTVPTSEPSPAPPTARSAAEAATVAGGDGGQFDAVRRFRERPLSTDMGALRDAVRAKCKKWGRVVVDGEPIGSVHDTHRPALLCYGELARHTLDFAPEAVRELLEQGSWRHAEVYRGTPPYEEFDLIFYSDRERAEDERAEWLSQKAREAEVARKLVARLVPRMRGQPAPMAEIRAGEVDSVPPAATAAAVPATAGTTEPPAFELHETGNAERLAYRYGHQLRYCVEMRKWLVWDGCRWESDATDPAVQSAVKETVAAMIEDVPADAEGVDVLRAHQRKSYSCSQRVNMQRLAESEIPIRARLLDSDPLLLNVANGTVDLRSGDFREARQSDYITKMAPVVFDEAATAPRWGQFLLECMGKYDRPEEMVEYLRRLVGYCLTGDVSEHVLPFFCGDGQNGKSTLCKTLQVLLGDYAGASSSGFLMRQHFQSHPTELASLAGKRLVICQETDEDRRLDESKLKQLTGGDTLKVRRMYEDEWDLEPTHKIILCGNHQPSARGMDGALWRRIKLIEFRVTFTEEQRDPNLKQKLAAELPGILQWAIQGCLEWRARGLGEPEAVRAATRAYRDSMDVFREFVSDAFKQDPQAEVSAGDVAAAYRLWSRDRGAQFMSPKAIGDSLRRLGYSQRVSHGSRLYAGLKRK